MEWLWLLGAVLGTLLLILVLAPRAARPDQPIVDPDDADPHAGTLQEVAGQEGPRVWDP